MDIDQARTFLTITAHGSFVEAGRQLHLTQSTVSARIQRLEEELGIRLFTRNRSGATLNLFGMCLIFIDNTAIYRSGTGFQCR